MTIATDILEKSREVFDVAGMISFGNKILLVLGLESTTERNLDDFGHVDGNFRLYGFEKHVQHRLDELLLFIYNTGYAAETVGRIGYPLKGESPRAAQAQLGPQSSTLRFPTRESGQHQRGNPNSTAATYGPPSSRSTNGSMS